MAPYFNYGVTAKMVKTVDDPIIQYDENRCSPVRVGYNSQ